MASFSCDSGVFSVLSNACFVLFVPITQYIIWNSFVFHRRDDGCSLMSCIPAEKRPRLLLESVEDRGSDEDLDEVGESVLNEMEYVQLFMRSYGFENIPEKMTNTLISILKTWVRDVAQSFQVARKTYYRFNVKSYWSRVTYSSCTNSIHLTGLSIVAFITTTSYPQRNIAGHPQETVR